MKKQLQFPSLVLPIFLALATFIISCKNESDSAEVEPLYYTVSFDSNGGTEVASQSVESGKTATKPANPTKAASKTATFSFSGWDKESAAFDFSTPITSDITLTARWTETAIPAETSDGNDENNQNDNEDDAPILPEQWDINSYTVTFNTNGGSPVASQMVKYNGVATNPAAPTKDGFDFTGWYADDEVFDFSAKITGNITLTAKWELSTHATKDTIVDLIQSQTSSNTLYLSGAIDVSDSESNTIRQTNAALKELYKKDSSIKISLDISGAAGLTTLENALPARPGYSFYGCSNLVSITLPQTLTEIDSYAFGECKGLTDITIPDGVTSIGKFAFSSCKALKTVTLGKQLSKIFENAFSACNSLENVYFTGSKNWVQHYYQYGTLQNKKMDMSNPATGAKELKGYENNTYWTVVE